MTSLLIPDTKRLTKKRKKKEIEALLSMKFFVKLTILLSHRNAAEQWFQARQGYIQQYWNTGWGHKVLSFWKLRLHGPSPLKVRLKLGGKEHIKDLPCVAESVKIDTTGLLSKCGQHWDSVPKSNHPSHWAPIPLHHAIKFGRDAMVNTRSFG